MLNYTEGAPGVVVFVGRFRDAAVSARLRRVEESEKCLLVERGFHWINEYPVNR